MAQGYGERAEPLLEQAIALARRIGALGISGIASYTLGEVFLTRGDVRRAVWEYAGGLRFLHRVGLKDHQITVVTMLASAVAVGRSSQAVRLLGAAEAAGEMVGYVLEPRLLGQLEQAVDQLRSKLDPRVLADAWVAGRALSFDEAAAEALALADELALQPTEPQNPDA